MDDVTLAGPILVLGAGMVGTFAARAIAAAGIPVAAADISPNRRFFRRHGPADDVPLIELDIHDEAALRELLWALSVDTIVLSAGMNRSAAHRDHKQAWSVNVEASKSVADTALQCGVRRLVFTSSYAVYGLPDHGPVTEAAPARPVSEYGRMKAAAEQTLEEMRQRGLSVTILRLCGVYGPARGDTGSSHATQFVATALAQLARTGQLVIRAPTVAVDEFLYVKDVAKAIAMIATTDPSVTDDIFNVGAGTAVTAGQVSDSLKRLFPAARVEVSPTPSSGRARPALDTTRIRHQLGFQPDYGLTDGLADLMLELTAEVR